MESKVLDKAPTFSEDASLDALRKAKLRLEAEVEAIREAELPLLPEGDHLATAQAVLENDVHRLKRTLKYFQNLDSVLEKQDRSLSTTLQRCREIESELKKCVEAPWSEAEGILVATRLKGVNGVFKAMRSYFRTFLEQIDDQSSGLSVTGPLQELCTKMLDSPSDPYIELSELDINNKTLMFLLMHNLVQRHSHDPTKIRLLDPRLE